MENFDFDNRLKKGLDNINPILDNSEIWDNIEPHLKKKKKRRFIIWFFFGALGVLGLLWIQSTNTLKENQISENQAEQPIETPSRTDITGITNITDNTKNIDKQNLTTEKKTSVQNNSVKKNNPKLTKKSISSVDQNPLNSNETFHKIKNIAGKNQASRAKSKEKPEENIYNPVVIANNNNNNNNEEEVDFAKNGMEITDKFINIEKNTLSKTIDENQKIDSSPQIENTPTQRRKDKTKPVDSKSIEPQKTESNETSFVPSKKQESSKKLTKKEREAAIKERKKNRKKAKEEKEKRKEAKKGKNKLTEPNKLPKWKYNLQLMGSGIYTNHTLKEGNQVESEYLRNREAYVTSREGFGFDLNLIAESPSGFLLIAGAQFQELHEKLNRQETVSESELEEVVETITENAEGEIINTTSSLQLVTTTTSYNQQLHNKYRFFNIPIGVGYAFTLNKMRFKFLGGVDLNTYYKFSGSIFDRQLDVIRLDSRASLVYNKIFEKNVGIGIWANVEWHKPINNQLSIVVASGIQTPLNSLTKNDETWPTSHKLFKIKLGVGMNYMFGDIKKPKKRKRKG